MKTFFTFNFLDRKNTFIFFVFLALNIFNDFNLRYHKQIIYYNNYYPIFTFFKYLSFVFFTFFLYLIESKNFII
jgi:hypothetical protein